MGENKQTRDELFKERQEAMPDAELCQKVKDEVRNMCKSGGRSFTMRVPVAINDTDMLICELVRRFEQLREENALLKANSGTSEKQA